MFSYLAHLSFFVQEANSMSWETSEPIVVPVDFSGISVRAVKTAIEMAADVDQIHVVHVVPILDQIAPGNSAWSLPTDEDRRTAVQEHFSEFMTTHGFDKIRVVILDGRPGTEIPEYAAKVNAGLVIIPSHGYHGVKRLLLGSVAEQVIRHASCPVFVLRRTDAE